MKNRLSLLAIAVAVSACAADTTVQWTGECTTPEARLAALGINASDIAQIDLVVDRATEGGVISRRAWARLKSCTGYVVVRLDAPCERSDAYTTGDCRLPQKQGA